jgi:hypothetical protein
MAIKVRQKCFIKLSLRFKYNILFLLCFFIFNKTYAQFLPGDPIITDPISLFTPCQNSGFEEGNFNNWQTFTGSVFSPTGGVNLSTFTQTLDPTQHQVINNNTNDFYGNFPLSQCGNKVAKIGDIVMGQDNHKAAMIKYTFIVTQYNVNFSFRYAMVLQNPDGHLAN